MSGGGTLGVTGSGIVGTPGYMSPEQARGEKVIDGRSDIYALGIIVFEMLTGKLPYEADTPMGVIVKHITEPVPRILDVKPDLPRGCEMIIEQAMAKDRDERFATANDLAETLSGVAKGEQVTVQTLARRTARAKRSQVAPAPEPRRTSPWVWVVGGLVALGLVAGLALGGGAIFSALTGATAAATLSPADLTSTQSSQITATADFAITETAEAEAVATAEAEAALAAMEAGTATAEAEAAVALAAATQFSLEATTTAEAESNVASAATSAERRPAP